MANNSINSVKKFIAKNGHVRACYVDMSAVIREACLIQNTNLSSSIALGRVMLGAVLMASQLKNDQVLAIHFKCSGPLKTLYAQASYEGKVRGYVANPQAPDVILQHQISVAPLVGDGTLTVSTYIPSSRLPQSSFINIVSGEIGEDLAHYMSQSMQIPCILTLGIFLDPEGKIEIASGLLIELMPGHTESDINLIETDFKKLPPLSTLVKAGKSHQDLMNLFLKDFEMEELDHPYKVEYHCSCSRQRVEDSFKLLAEQDWQDTFSENIPVDVNCQMCGKKYILTISDLLEIYEGFGNKKVH